jgi:molybdenum cofactor biosynthesis protein B
MSPTPRPLGIALLTLSDTRGLAEDRSGDLLEAGFSEAGHTVVERSILREDTWPVRARLCAWVADQRIEVIVTSGGTGVTGRDRTPEIVAPLFDRRIDGFGELFRQLSFADIGASTIQSRATAGICGTTFLFCLPGSTGACRLALEHILLPQLDLRTTPCNFTQLIERMGTG